MKKILSFLSLAALVTALLGSCVKDNTERIDKLDGDVAKLEEAIGQYTQFKKEISQAVQTLENEVGSKPADVQNTIWACITSLKGQCGTFDTAINTLKALVGDKSVSEQVNDLVAKYQLEGLAASVKAIKDALGDPAALVQKVNDLQTKVDEIDGILARITAIEGMIQSVSVIPAYDDGSVLATEDGVLTVNFIVKPAVALSNIKSEELASAIKVLAAPVKTVTKASGLFREIAVSEAAVLDAGEGTVCVKADLNADLEDLGDGEALAVALNVKNGISDFTTEFVKVTVAVEPEFLPGLFSISGTMKVQFSRGNLATDGNGYYICRTQTETGSLFSSVEESYSIGGQTWRTLSSDEWNYMLRNKCVPVETENGVFGLAIMPDDYEEEVSGKTWAELEAAGAVLMSASGYSYDDSGVWGINEGGSYWNNDGKSFDFDCVALYPGSNATPAGIRQSIRLVKVVEQN